MRVLVIPSWYPSQDAPTAGVFIQQQVRALSELVDVAVVHVEPGRIAIGPQVTQEDGVTVVRAGVDATAPVEYLRLDAARFMDTPPTPKE